MESSLKLFRRHEGSCTEHHPKEQRILEADSLKRTGKAQCSCPIYAEGTLRSEHGKKYIRPKSTGCREWSQARKVVSRWLEWGNTEAPIAPESVEYKLLPLRDAIKQFIENQRKNKRGDKRMKAYTYLLERRLIPFAAAKGITYIQETNRAKFWADFRHSWRNENPLRNRKPQPGQAIPIVQLHTNTDSRMIGDLRVFMRFCVSRELLSDNWASKDHAMVRTGVVEPKEPFTDDELEYIFEATKHLTDGCGFGSAKRVDTPNGRETLTFVWTLLHTGLRISDVTALQTSQLVDFNSGSYTHALYVNPIKTKGKRRGNWVHIPVPNGRIPGEPDLVSALKALSKKNDGYFFLGGIDPVPAKGTQEWINRIESGRKSWWGRLDKLFRKASALMKKEGIAFSHSPQPHRFRHTFAATLLKAGVSIRIVAQYLGDTEDVVRKHYSKFCVAEQVEAAKIIEHARMKASEERAQQRRAKMKLIG